MADTSSVFAFWQEKDRETKQNSPTPVRNKTILTERKETGKEVSFTLPADQEHYFNSVNTQATSFKSLPGHTSLSSKSSSALNTTDMPSTYNTRPIHRNRPHSVVVLSKRFENSEIPSTHAPVDNKRPTTPRNPSSPIISKRPSPPVPKKPTAKKPSPPSPKKLSPTSLKRSSSTTRKIPIPVTLRGPNHEPIERNEAHDRSCSMEVNHSMKNFERTETVKSAPPTIDERRSAWGNKDKKDSLSSFVSYVDFESLDGNDSDTENIDTSDKRMRRSSPVVTKVPKIRHYSAMSIRRETTRVLLRERRALNDPLMEEVETFWKMVKRIIAEKEKESTYLTSVTISRFTPNINNEEMNSQSTCPETGYGSATADTVSDVTLVVETGPVIQGVNAIQILCRVKCLVSEAIEKVLSVIEHTHPNVAQGQHNYQLKVCGKDEYLESDRCLLDYEYTHNCIKLASPICLVLMERSLVKQVVSRTTNINPEMPSLFGIHALPFNELTNLIDSYLSKDDDFRTFLKKPPVNYIRMCHQIIACVRLICERMGFVEPVCLSEAIFELQRACQAIGGNTDFSISFEIDNNEHSGRRSNTITSGQLQDIRDHSAVDAIKALDKLKCEVESTVSMYCQLCQCPYEPVWIDNMTDTVSAAGGLIDNGDLKFRVKVCGLHRIPVAEYSNYNTFKVEVSVYHCGKTLCKRILSPPAKLGRNFFSTITWSKWMKCDLIIADIPREARVCFTLYGLTLPTNPKEYRHATEPLAWVAKQLFTTSGKLVKGPYLLGMWKDESPADPTDTPYPNMEDKKCLILDVCFDDIVYEYGTATRLNVPTRSSTLVSPSRPSPPLAVAKNMQDIASKDRFERQQEADLRLVWSHRASIPNLLSPYARGLPVFTQSIPTTTFEDIKKYHNLLLLWPIYEPTYGLELLDSQYSDIKVRSKATQMISQLSEDDFVDLLPQILQSLKHDCYMNSSMHELLLKQAIASPRTAHYLYWNLISLTYDNKFGWRYQLLLSAVLAACGEELEMEFYQQSSFIDSLSEIAATMKSTRDVHRQTCLVHALKDLSSTLPPVFRLPLNPALQCCDVDLEGCSFFNSKTVPLKLSFKNADPFGKNIQVIFKAGDDLRQDMLALQLIQLMDKIWLRAGLDLRLITYQVLATGEEQGFVELVTDSATLRQIQTEHGVTGSFKDKPLWQWLMRYNSSDAAWKRATENFTLSCAGYCVATYVLGICDRHNDNIMVKKSGHMFHIDFGKILGKAQMFGSIKRDRAPFVLTPDMAYVINAGDKPSVRFQKFTDLCCAAFNELRKHSHLFLSLLCLLLSSNLPEMSSMDDIKFVRDALLPSDTNEEATFHFTKHIEASLGSLSTQINFFIHNLAQYKFSSHASSQGLLSFSPTSYSMFTDGKISSAIVVAYHLRYYPEKYIVYQIQVHRHDSSKPDTILFRRYSEFDELHNKLLESFPEDSLPHLPGKTYLPGRSYTKETSEKRRDVLNSYLSSMLDTDPKISESDVVYTFLHCLLRDEQDLIKMREDEQATENRVAGKVKLDLRYNEQFKKFTIMVQHVQSLIPREGSDSADPYVKLYLAPDPNKLTKLKTKIARKTLNPTYNEMLHYNLTSNELKEKQLKLTVWDASSLLGKECLGITIIDLDSLYKELLKGHVDWFELQSTTSFVNR